MVRGNAPDPGVHNSPSVADAAADLARSNLPADTTHDIAAGINPFPRTVPLYFADHSYLAVGKVTLWTRLNRLNRKCVALTHGSDNFKFSSVLVFLSWVFFAELMASRNKVARRKGKGGGGDEVSTCGQ